MTFPYLRFAQVILIWFAGLGAATQFAKIAVPFAEISLLYLEQSAVIGWLLSIISLMGAVFGATSGAITARVGRRGRWIVVNGGHRITAARRVMRDSCRRAGPPKSASKAGVVIRSALVKLK